VTQPRGNRHPREDAMQASRACFTVRTKAIGPEVKASEPIALAGPGKRNPEIINKIQTLSSRQLQRWIILAFPSAFVKQNFIFQVSFVTVGPCMSLLVPRK
jgi:hypothetical protein